MEGLRAHLTPFEDRKKQVMNRVFLFPTMHAGHSWTGVIRDYFPNNIATAEAVRVCRKGCHIFPYKQSFYVDMRFGVPLQRLRKLAVEDAMKIMNLCHEGACKSTPETVNGYTSTEFEAVMGLVMLPLVPLEAEQNRC